MQEDEKYILLMSHTGAGKSSLANALTKTEDFKVGKGVTSETYLCQVGSVSKEFCQRNLNVIDTPGLMDVDGCKSSRMAEFLNRFPQVSSVHQKFQLLFDKDTRLTMLAVCYAVVAMAKNGFDVILLIFPCGHKFTQQERYVFELINKRFGDDFYKHCIFVWTKADGFENDEEFYGQLETDRTNVKDLDDLLTNCGNRIAPMSTHPKCDKAIQQRQIRHLLDLVDQVINQMGRPFINDQLKEVQRIMARHSVEDVRVICEKDVNSLNIHKEIEWKITPEDFQQQFAKKLLAALATGRGCFPVRATVRTPIGPLAMHELQLGQLVLCQQDCGDLAYSPVYMWGHRDPTACLTCFVTVRTSRAQLTLSADHLVPLLIGEGTTRYVAARDVRPGDSVLTLEQGDAGQPEHRLVPDQVTSVERQVRDTGLFAPFTLCGNLLVDGMLASCYIDCLPHGVSHSLLWPVRAVWRLSPAVGEAVNRLGADGLPVWVSRLALPLLQRAGKWRMLAG